MDRYLPSKDLPQDIKCLPREETVCQFCGVSYLIHHEVKTLETNIADLRTQLQRKAGLEDEKMQWNQEKEKLQLSVKCLENDLTNIKAVRSDLEREKSTWDQERQKLLHSIKSLEIEKATISENFISCTTELQEAKETLSKKKNELSRLAQFASEKEKKISLKLIAAFSLPKQMKVLCDTSRNDITNMQTYFVACIGKIMQVCTEHDAKVSSWVRSRLSGLRSELTAERSKYDTAFKDWTSTREALLQQVKLKEERNQHLATELIAIQEARKICSSELAKYQKSFTTMNDKIRYLEDELSRIQSTEELHINRHQAIIGELQEKLSLTEKELADAKTELLSLKESYSMEAKSKQRLLDEARMQVSSVNFQLKQLSISHEQEIQKNREIYNDELRRVKELCEKQNKVTLEKVLTKSNTDHELLRKQISELKGTVENQHILIQTLHDDIRKEKAVLDAELTTHLHEVKNLEMKLREEQVRTQTMTHSNGHALRAVQDQLEAKVKLCSDLESKLSGCYEEISHLQTTVQRECEERRILERDLEESRTACRKLGNQSKLLRNK